MKGINSEPIELFYKNKQPYETYLILIIYVSALEIFIGETLRNDIAPRTLWI